MSALARLAVSDLLGGGAAVALFACGAWTGYRVALYLLPEARASVRAAGAALIWLWLLVALFWLLAAVGGFATPAAAAAWAVLAAVRRRFRRERPGRAPGCAGTSRPPARWRRGG